MNDIIKSATLKLFHYETIDEYAQHLAKFLNYYNFSKQLKSLKFKTPYDIILKRYEDQPSLLLEESSVLLSGTKQLTNYENTKTN